MKTAERVMKTYLIGIVLVLYNAARAAQEATDRGEC
jgi:hypothetical protein